MSQPDDWKIPGGTERCSECDTELRPQEISTAILEFAEDGPRRVDLCERCGNTVEESTSAYYWRRRLPEAGDRRPVVDYGVLRRVFEGLLARSEPVYQRLAYLVGLVLIRKRHLRLLGFEVLEGREVMRVRRAVGEPERLVPAPYLSAEDMVETRGHLTRLLAADLPDDLSLLEAEARTPPAGEDAGQEAGEEVEAAKASGRAADAAGRDDGSGTPPPS